MERIARDVRRELDRFGPSPGLADLVAAWPEAVGAEVARNAWPARIGRDGTLHVATSSSAWAFELAQLAGEVLDRLRARLGAATPPALRFAVGKIPELSSVPGTTVAERPREPTLEERERAAEIASSITDGDLRETVVKTVEKGLVKQSDDRLV